jgi:DoxX-like family
MTLAGRIINGLVVVFLAFDGVVKLLALPVAVDATVRLGYPASVVVPLGIVELLSLAVYVIPRTSALGAVLLTGYLGGATASQVRVGDPWFLFPVFVGLLVWASWFMRAPGLAMLLFNPGARVEAR